MKVLTFRRHLSLHFLKTYGKPACRRKIMLNPVQDVRYDGRNHLPEYSATDKKCRFCGSKAKFVCVKCKVGLHPKDCFYNTIHFNVIMHGIRYNGCAINWYFFEKHFFLLRFL
jgi:hypothetical protein